MDDYLYDPDDEDYEPDHEEQIQLGTGIWLILHHLPGRCGSFLVRFGRGPVLAAVCHKTGRSRIVHGFFASWRGALIACAGKRA